MGNDVVVENRNRFYKNRLWARELSEARCLPALALNGTSGRVKFRLPAADSKIIINAKHSIKPHTFSLMIESYKYRTRLYSVLHLECRTPVERCLDERYPYLHVRDCCRVELLQRLEAHMAIRLDDALWPCAYKPV
jgi:hypothetical protein